MSEPEVRWLEDDPQRSVAAAREVLKYGQTVVFPTDTVYGLLAKVSSAAAYRRIYELKGRSFDKPLALLTYGSMTGPDPDLLNGCGLLADYQAGAATVVVSSNLLRRLPAMVADIQPGSVGVRQPQHKYARAVIGYAQWVWATSVNRSGEPPATTADEVLAWLEELKERDVAPPELVVLSRTPGSGRPSSVIDLTGDEPKRLR